MITPVFEGRTLTKAHATGNDFILVPDFDGRMVIDPESVAKICHRRFGIGADGLIRVVRTARIDGYEDLASEAEWFMDYRNADGSLAEMCGNGVRAFVHYLRIQGIVDLANGTAISVATRGGIKRVTFDDTTYTVDMGEYGLPFGAAGADTRVTVPGVGSFDALSVTMPNPHTVVILDTEDQLDAARLTEDPAYEPMPAHGTNLELIVASEPVARMRVLERGVGETYACGTGTCAAALGVLLNRGKQEGSVTIESPGGRLDVRIEAGRAYLTGPAILVAEFGLIGVAGYSEQ